MPNPSCSRIATAMLSLVLIACLPWPARAVEQATLLDFATPTSRGNASLSPDGETLALAAYTEAGRGLVFISLDDMSLRGSFGVRGTYSPSSITWVSNDRVAFTLRRGEALTRGSNQGALFAIGADGQDYKRLDAKANFSNWQVLRIIDPLPDDPDWAVVEVNHTAERMNPHHAEAYRINTRTAEVKLIADGPTFDWADLIASPDGQIRFSNAYTENQTVHYYSRAANDREWQRRDFTDHAILETGLLPAGASQDAALALQLGERGHVCLTSLSVDPNTAPRQLACHPTADVETVITSFDGSTPIAAVASPGRPELLFLESGHPDEKRLKALHEAFAAGDQFVIPVGASRSGHRAILLAYSDRAPGDYYLYERDTHEVRFLFSSRPWVDADAMVPQHAVDVQARDGVRIPTLLSTPQNDGPAPMVVHPHGGPIGIRDRWGWSAEVQALGSQGFAVLQPNFRGSSGYGTAHLDRGKHAYGTGMIDDIIDATEWAIEQGHADPARICISGASYGGFAALSAGIARPDLYSCVITVAGIYDLNDWNWRLWAENRTRGSDFMEKYVGNRSRRKAQSPSRRIADLKAPALVIHGTKDRVVDVGQAEDLIDALEDLGHPVDAHFIEGEGHAGWARENEHRRLTLIVEFLRNHIGSKAPSANASPTESSARQLPDFPASGASGSDSSSPS